VVEPDRYGLPVAPADRETSTNAAPLARRILRHGRYDTAAMLRNGEQLVLAFVLPL
jgi:ABC-2 type transport system permease protein